MLCKNQQSNPNNFPVGVLSFGSDRTEYDIQLMKQSDTSNIPDTLLTLGKKENYHTGYNNSSSNPYRIRTEYDIQLMKQSNTSNIPDTLLTLGKKENYHACHNNSSSNPYRTLAWDDPDNPRSYNIRT